MTSQLPHTMALLDRTPAVLDALLRDLPDAWTLASEGPETWSPSEVVSHLIHTDRTNWMPRVRTILQSDDVPAFPSYDRHGFEVATAVPLATRLDEFQKVRRAGLDELRGLHLQAGDLERQGQHPALGVVTLAQLLAAWTTHDLTHLHQIARVMAHQYRDAVGPWSRYLGVLHCDGHGSR